MAAACSTPSPIGDGSGLMVRRIAHERTRVFASPAYPEKHGVPETVGDLARHQAISYGRNGRVQRWLFPREQGSTDEASPFDAMMPDISEA